MKPGRHFGARDLGECRQARHDQFGQRAGILAGRLCQHHRGVGREIAMARVAWRLDRDIPSIETGRQVAGSLEVVENGADPVGEAGVERGQFHFRWR